MSLLADVVAYAWKDVRVRRTTVDPIEFEKAVEVEMQGAGYDERIAVSFDHLVSMQNLKMRVYSLMNFRRELENYEHTQKDVSALQQMAAYDFAEMEYYETVMLADALALLNSYMSTWAERLRRRARAIFASKSMLPLAALTTTEALETLEAQLRLEVQTIDQAHFDFLGAQQPEAYRGMVGGVLNFFYNEESDWLLALGERKSPHYQYLPVVLKFVRHALHQTPRGVERTQEEFEHHYGGYLDEAYDERKHYRVYENLKRERRRARFVWPVGEHFLKPAYQRGVPAGRSTPVIRGLLAQVVASFHTVDDIADLFAKQTSMPAFLSTLRMLLGATTGRDGDALSMLSEEQITDTDAYFERSHRYVTARQRIYWRHQLIVDFQAETQRQLDARAKYGNAARRLYGLGSPLTARVQAALETMSYYVSEWQRRLHRKARALFWPRGDAPLFSLLDVSFVDDAWLELAHARRAKLAREHDAFMATERSPVYKHYVRKASVLLLEEARTLSEHSLAVAQVHWPSEHAQTLAQHYWPVIVHLLHTAIKAMSAPMDVMSIFDALADEYDKGVHGEVYRSAKRELAETPFVPPVGRHRFLRAARELLSRSIVTLDLEKVARPRRRIADYRAEPVYSHEEEEVELPSAASSSTSAPPKKRSTSSSSDEDAPSKTKRLEALIADDEEEN